MKISQLFHAGRPIFSFEFFPPKDDAAAAALMETIEALRGLKPDFVSVTYGAGGSTRTKTLELVARIKHQLHIEAMAHLTCVGHSRQEIDGVLKELAAAGIENILALRGDPPRGQSQFVAHPAGFHYANELVGEIVKVHPFCIGVAGYPEKHIEAESMEADLAALKRKVDAGASFVTTQLFFVNDFYFEFVSRARAIGVGCPIIPGIMPITNYAQIQRFASLCGATIPAALHAALDPVKDDAEAVARIGIEHAAAQCRDLLYRGAPGIHFYTLNKSRATHEVLQHLRGLREPTGPLLRDV